jgi:hypothetical protein
MPLVINYESGLMRVTEEVVRVGGVDNTVLSLMLTVGRMHICLFMYVFVVF